MTTIWRSSLILLAVTAVLGAACSPEAPKFRSTDISGAEFGKELALTGHDGKPRALADFRGKVVVLSFGFTHCPDICPTTLADMAAVMKKLGPDAAHVQVLFVTVDPERDTPEVLAKYVPAFDPGFLGLTGDVAATQRAAKEFKIFYEKRGGSPSGAYTVDPERDTPQVLAQYVPAFDPRFLGLYGDAAATQRAAKEFKIFYEKRAGGAPGAYSIDHSAQSYVLDAKGRPRLLVRHDRIAADLEADLRALLKGEA